MTDRKPIASAVPADVAERLSDTSTPHDDVINAAEDAAIANEIAERVERLMMALDSGDWSGVPDDARAYIDDVAADGLMDEFRPEVLYRLMLREHHAVEDADVRRFIAFMERACKEYVESQWMPEGEE